MSYLPADMSVPLQKKLPRKNFASICEHCSHSWHSSRIWLAVIFWRKIHESYRDWMCSILSFFKVIWSQTGYWSLGRKYPEGTQQIVQLVANMCAGTLRSLVESKNTPHIRMEYVDCGHRWKGFTFTSQFDLNGLFWSAEVCKRLQIIRQSDTDKTRF